MTITVAEPGAISVNPASTTTTSAAGASKLGPRHFPHLQREAVPGPPPRGILAQHRGQQHRTVAHLRGGLAHGHPEVGVDPDDRRRLIQRARNGIVGQFRPADLELCDEPVLLPHRRRHQSTGRSPIHGDGHARQRLDALPMGAARTAGDLADALPVPAAQVPGVSGIGSGGPARSAARSSRQAATTALAAASSSGVRAGRSGFGMCSTIGIDHGTSSPGSRSCGCGSAACASANHAGTADGAVAESSQSELTARGGPGGTNRPRGRRNRFRRGRRRG